MPHGSVHQVVRRPATSAEPAVRNSTPRASSSDRVRSRSSHSRPMCVSPGRVIGWCARVGAARDRGFGILDELEHVVAGPEADDGGLEDNRGRDELAHVVLVGLACRPVGRREHLQAEYVASTTRWRRPHRGRTRRRGRIQSAFGSEPDFGGDGPIGGGALERFVVTLVLIGVALRERGDGLVEDPSVAQVRRDGDPVA